MTHRAHIQGGLATDYLLSQNIEFAERDGAFVQGERQYELPVGLMCRDCYIECPSEPFFVEGYQITNAMGPQVSIGF
jgi:hypothetical protein